LTANVPTRLHEKPGRCCQFFRWSPQFCFQARNGQCGWGKPAHRRRTIRVEDGAISIHFTREMREPKDTAPCAQCVGNIGCGTVTQRPTTNKKNGNMYFGSRKNRCNSGTTRKKNLVSRWKNKNSFGSLIHSTKGISNPPKS